MEFTVVGAANSVERWNFKHLHTVFLFRTMELLFCMCIPVLFLKDMHKDAVGDVINSPSSCFQLFC